MCFKIEKIESLWIQPRDIIVNYFHLIVRVRSMLTEET